MSETPPKPPGTDAARLWRSVEEQAGSAPTSPQATIKSVSPTALDRRAILHLMAASLSAGSLTGCGDSGGKPLLSHPRGEPGRDPGEPLVFATTLDHDGSGFGVLVTTRDGRPTKIAGNPLHPASRGASDAWAEAELFSFYDPDRLEAPQERGVTRSLAELARFTEGERKTLAMHGGRGLHLLSRPTTSPTTARIMKRFSEAFPEAIQHVYAPLSDDTARDGAMMAFGQAVETVLDLGLADVVLCLGGDLFLDSAGHVRHAGDYAARRRIARTANDLPRLHVAETQPGITGARADRRVVLAPDAFESFARAILSALDGAGIAPETTPHPDAARAIAADLVRARQRGVVAVGREQPAIVHALAHAINAKLGAVGHTVRYTAPIAAAPMGRLESILALAEAIRAGSVAHLVILDGNPVYDAPADLDFETLLRRVPVSLHLAFSSNETSRACGWTVPQRHALESWGDVRGFDGSVGLRQPVVTSTLPAFSIDEFAALFLGNVPDGKALVRETWRDRFPDAAEETWLSALEDGVVPDTASPPLEATLRPDWDPGPTERSQHSGLSIVFSADPSVRDGTYANNAWLQELPRPLTKICWGNAALIAPATARRLGFTNGDVVELGAGGRTVQAPLWLTPGHAPETVTLPLGYGRTAAGRIGTGIGFDAYRLRSSDHPWVLPSVTITRTGQRQEIITTQDHHRLESDDIVRVVESPESLAEKQPKSAPVSFYADAPEGDHAWAMTIDLDACIGCNACVVACQAENTVPAVGPEEVARGREMHWLRIDRYHAGDPTSPDTYFQPVPCMHCEKAPCEVVCPVNATVHSSEGLNDMVYARCIGTRTCSNNCPYKVRRFNWFDYGNRSFAEAAASHPEVPARERGVMEKCTYCVQRIRTARIGAQLDGRPIEDKDVVTACQQACPTQAITFGDLKNRESAVSREKADPRHYALLGELNTRPRTTYLARIALHSTVRDAEEGR